MTVLITRFSAIGDVAMTIPVVYNVARSNPGIKFVMVTRPSMATMFLNPPSNLQVRGVDVHDPRYKGLMGIRRLYLELKQECGFDAVADLHGVLRTWGLDAMAKLDGMKVSRIDKSRGQRRALTRPNDKVLLPLIPQRTRYAEVFTNLGLEFADAFHSIFGDGKGEPEMFSVITQPKKNDERWVAIAPFAKHPGKIYPPRLMQQVVKALAEKGRRIFLFGGGGDEEKVLSQWADAYPGVISLAGKKYGFPVEMALLSHMDVAVTMDSANMHLASLVGVPVVSVWGATHPYCGFKGHGQDDADTVQLSMTCRPCSIFGDKPCHRGDYHCLAGISPATILEKVERRL